MTLQLTPAQQFSQITLPIHGEFTHIAHLSDIHIRPLDRHYEYQSVFQELYQELLKINHKFIIAITGDLLHNKLLLSTELLQLTGEFLTQLDEIAPCIIILGNHDLNLQNHLRPHALTTLFTEGNKFTKPFKQTFLLEKSGIYHCGNLIISLASIQNPLLPIPQQIISHQQNTFKIALFHGGVGSYSNENGTTQNSHNKLSIFDGYDYVLLGDIHLRQFLDTPQKRIAYAGSLIQQNRMETFSDHGFLLWDLHHQNHKWINVLNKYGGILNIFIHQNYIYFHPRNTNLFTLYEDSHEIIFPLQCPPENDLTFWSQFLWDKGLYHRHKTSIYIHIPPESIDVPKWHLSLARFYHKKYQIPTENIFVMRHFHDELSQNKQNNIPENDTYENHQWTIKDAIENIDVFTEYLNKSYPNNFSLPGGDTWNNEIKQKVITQYLDTIKWIQKNSNDIYQNIHQNGGTPLTPINLQWSNLFCYDENNQINFQLINDKKVFNISGKNFSGKSSIIDIILFSLYGKTSRGNAKNTLNHLSKNGACSIEFLYGEYKYRIQRNIKAVRSTVEQSLLLFEKWNQDALNWDNLNEDGIQKTQKAIEDMIGPMKIYTDGPIFLQGQADEFFQLTPSERKNLLLKKLNFECVDKINEYLRSKHNELNNELKVNKTLIKNAITSAQNIHIHESIPTQIDYNPLLLWQSIQNVYQFVSSTLPNIQSKLNELEQELNRLNQLKNISKPSPPSVLPGNLNECLQRINSLSTQLQECQNDHIAFSKARTYLEEKSPFLHELLNKLNHLNADLISRSTELRVENMTLQSIPTKSNNEWEHIILKSQTELDEVAPELNQLQQNYNDIQNKLNIIGQDNIQHEILIGETARQNIENRKKLNLELNERRNFISNFAQSNGTPHHDCQFCSQNPTVAQFHQINTEIPLLEQQIHQLNESIKEYKIQQNKEICQLLREEQSIKINLDDMMSVSQEPRLQIEIAHKGLHKNKVALELNEVMSQLRINQQKLNELNFFISNHKKAPLPKWIEPSIVGELPTLIHAFQKELKMPEEIQRELDYEMAKKEHYLKYQKELNTYQTELQNYHSQIENIQKQIENNLAEKNKTQSQLLILNKTENALHNWMTQNNHLSPQNIETLEEKVMFSGAIASIFSRHGFPFFLMQKIIQQIIHALNHELSQLTDFHIRAEFDESDRKADKTDIHFYIQKHNAPDNLYDLNQGSGFERFISAILWRIHSARMYHPAHIMPLSYIIFDESFHFWDYNQLGTLDTLFNYLSKYASNILVISHIPQVAELAHDSATVERIHGKFSHLQIPLTQPQSQTLENFGIVVVSSTNPSTSRKKLSTNATKKTSKPTKTMLEQAKNLGISTQKYADDGTLIDLNRDELQTAIDQQIQRNLFL